MLNWVKPFNIFSFLDNNEYNFSEPDFECLLAAGSFKTLQPENGNSFGHFQQFVNEEKDWIFGHLSYDLKNEIEDLTSENFDGVGFPNLFFFVPKIILILKKDVLEIGVITDDANIIYKEVCAASSGIHFQSSTETKKIKSRFSKEEYVTTVKQLQQHIVRGDCYEINFCQEFYTEDCVIYPLDIYLKLGEVSPNPFAAFYKLNDKYLICSSPERYLKKEGNKIISQPIKGTSKRNLNNQNEDDLNKKSLLQSEKETAENVMVVDLVRNDMSKVCEEGSVKVDELFGLYSFPQVHQMISTVSGTLKEGVSLSDILKATFPVASMTGVPKKRVMELIENYERTKRGLFSGVVGYINPEGNFDFNVVIRSLLYNNSKRYLSIQAGSAITFYSDAEEEYEECLMKIEAMKKVLE